MKTMLGLLLAASVAVPCRAGVTIAPMNQGKGPAVLIEGGCGPYEWRDDRGYCHPKQHEDRRPVCPRGYHLGEHGERCWPN